MAGLLDFLPEDQNDRRALVQGLLAGAFGAMNGRGSRLQAWGQGGLAGLTGYGNELERQSVEKQRAAQMKRGLLQDQLLEGQIADQQRQQAQAKAQQDWLASLQSPQQQANAAALSGGGGPTLANAAQVAPVDPSQQMMFDAVKVGAMPIQSYISATQKDNSPLTVKEGESLLDRKTFKPIFQNQKEDDFIRNMRAAGVDPSSPAGRKYIQQWLATKSTHAPPVSVTVTAEKGYAGEVAQGLAKNDVTAIEAARSAPDKILAAREVKRILATEAPMTGTGAEWRLAATKALSTAGLINGDSVKSTEDLASTLASQTLDSIKTSGLGGGQGFTDNDRKFLEMARSGRIDMNPGSLARLADLNEKAATREMERGNATIRRVRGAPGLAGIGGGLEEVVLPADLAPSRMPTPAEIAAEAARRAGMRK